MDEQLQDDPFDAKLREELPYIDDDGFTSRVAQQLPVRRRSGPARAAFLVSVSLLSAVVAFVAAGGTGFLMDVVGWFAVMPVSLMVSVAIACGLLVTALGVFLAISRARRVRS